MGSFAAKERQYNGKRKRTNMWHPSCYSCFNPGQKLYSFVFSIFNFSAGNILCFSFDWMDAFRFYKSMYIVIAKFGLHEEYI
jgi:hypothetical protein